MTESKLNIWVSNEIRPLVTLSQPRPSGGDARWCLEALAWAVEKEPLPLTEWEFLLTAAACNGLIWEPPEVSVKMVWAQVDDYLRLDGSFVPEGVDGQALVTKLQSLSPAQLLVLAVRVRQFWARAERETAPEE